MGGGSSSPSKEPLKPFKSGEKFKGLVYKFAISPHTNRVWLDRNLGAKRVCESFDDIDCYGDYYQFGRNTDGHEKINSATTTTLSKSLTNAGDKVVINSATRDWVISGLDDSGIKRSINWASTDGSSICPVGFRVPTLQEFRAETFGLTSSDKVNNKFDAFNSFLKLPSAYIRVNSAGNDVETDGAVGYMWVNSFVSKATPRQIAFNDNSISAVSDYMINGASIRCIQDDTHQTFSIKTNIKSFFINDGATKQIKFSIDDTKGGTLTLKVDIDNDILKINGKNNKTFTYTKKQYKNKELSFEVKSDYGVGGIAQITLTLSNSKTQIIKSFYIEIVKIHKSATEFEYKGLTYDIVTSPNTGRVWLDRNLGASRVCKNKDDDKCFGDYYQWGREADGHEKSNSATNKTLSASITNTIDQFILGTDQNDSDWLQDGVDDDGSLRGDRWSSTNGSSICPAGFRVPTIAELLKDKDDAGWKIASDMLDSFLKLSWNGYREADGRLVEIGLSGYLWTSGHGESEFFPRASTYLGLQTDDIIKYNSASRANGVAVRCIKD